MGQIGARAARDALAQPLECTCDVGSGHTFADAAEPLLDLDGGVASVACTEGAAHVDHEIAAAPHVCAHDVRLFLFDHHGALASREERRWHAGWRTIKPDANVLPALLREGANV